MTRTIDTGTDDLLAHVDGNVGVITFNRPERRNALSEGIYHGFGSALPVLAEDTDVRVVMVTGSGGAFCAGGDVKGMNEAHKAGVGRPGQPEGLEDRVAYLRHRQRAVSLALHQFAKPVVAALPGAAAGAGLSIALAADIRLAAERAILVTAFAGVGASGDFGGSWFLTQLLGPAKAKELYFTSPRLSAGEALELGMVNQVLPDVGFDQAALHWCQDLAERAPIATRLMKENINRAITCDLATALDAEAPNMIRAMSTEDHREAAAAFVEKRQPVFRGR
ncbi:MAG: enoyl-CoA hydratase-related protein [Ilumatobacter sp.]|uniref:enoyl-CoA hydratase-related protein n=1 Tax=Ilumatobacter sp. TaxID=1967498 RepID=UPI00262F1B2E|nr:enoyl-CoA hydratase-related protein [Ilumatobacter sp.]MDJ0769627.1 enoyl-CoA hydratase-related protein [Ilumatobacter sp.]